jgi:mycoredoxin
MAIRVFGADWCPLTTGTLRHLDKLGLQYEYVDIERDPDAAEWVRTENGGKEKKPTVDIDGVILSEPTNAELDRVLKQQNIAAAGR